MSDLFAELGIVCDRCDAHNAPAARGCSDCGHSFVVEQPAPKPQPALIQPSAEVIAPEVLFPTTPVAAAVPKPIPHQKTATPTAPSSAAVGSTGPITKPRPQAAPSRLPSAPIPRSPTPVQRPDTRLSTPVTPGMFAKLVTLRGSNPSSSFQLQGGMACAGTSKGPLLFPDDPFLSPLQASFIFRDGKLFVRDEGAPSGVFIRITSPEPLFPNSEIAVGEHLVRFLGALVQPTTSGPVPYGAPNTNSPLYCIEEILEGNRPCRGCARAGPVLTIGRSGCDLSFPNDTYIQPRHCEVVVTAQGALLRDYGTYDGTFIRLPSGGERSLMIGDVIRFGQQILRIEAS